MNEKNPDYVLLLSKHNDGRYMPIIVHIKEHQFIIGCNDGEAAAGDTKLVPALVKFFGGQVFLKQCAQN